MILLDELSNKLLIDAYKKANKLKFPDDFIEIINQELKKRGIKCCSRLKV